MMLSKTFFPRRARFHPSNRGQRHATLLKTCYDMNLSPSFRKSALGCCFALAFCLGSPAQTLFSTNGGQYPIAGLIPGSQVRPQVALSTSGGFLVWEDNNADKI